MKKFFFIILSLLFVFRIYGQQWELVESNTIQELHSVYFPTNQVGYIAGAHGTILKSTNGGSSWTKLNSGFDDMSLNSIFFTNEQTGVAVGNYSKILKTEDGGGSWIEIMSGYDYNFHVVRFLNNNTGFIAGSDGGKPCIMKTTDGGETWIKKTINYVNPYYLYSIDFINSNVGYAVGCKYSGGVYHGYVLKTIDGGETWNEESFGNVEAEFRSVFFYNNQVGYIAGGHYYVGDKEHYIIFKTTDGGTTWTYTTFETNQRSQAIFFTDINNGYITNCRGVIKTIDGGNSWFFEEIPGFDWGNSIFFTNEGTGIVVGYKGKIAKTSRSSCVEEMKKDKIEYYPNPTTGKVLIRPDFIVESITITDITGKVHQHIENLSSNEISLDLQGYSNGLYFIILKGKNIYNTIKIIVK